MPIYEFECMHCGHRFERLQKLSDPDPASCPVCGRPKIHRRLSAPSFRLTGSGWYETDFKNSGEKKRHVAENTAGEAGDAKNKSGSEAASASAAETKAAGTQPAKVSGDKAQKASDS